MGLTPAVCLFLLIIPIVTAERIKKTRVLLGPAEEFWHNGTRLGQGIVPLIAEGEDATPNALPSIVSIQQLDQGNVYHICGGTLGAKNKVLTAAHCLDEIEKYPFQVGLGYHVISDGLSNAYSQVIRVERYFIHREYDEDLDKGLPNDIAMLTLNKDAELYPGYVELQMYSSLHPWQLFGSDATLYGWGQLGENKSTADVLQTGQFKVLTRTQCSNLWSIDIEYHPKIHLCVLGKGVADCGGDSGGPMVDENNQQIGLASYGSIDCNPDYASLYTSIGQYYNWIQEKLNQDEGFIYV